MSNIIILGKSRTKEVYETLKEKGYDINYTSTLEDLKDSYLKNNQEKIVFSPNAYKTEELMNFLHDKDAYKIALINMTKEALLQMGYQEGLHFNEIVRPENNITGLEKLLKTSNN